jgi:hypothetical protein
MNPYVLSPLRQLCDREMNERALFEQLMLQVELIAVLCSSYPPAQDAAFSSPLSSIDDASLDGVSSSVRQVIDSISASAIVIVHHDEQAFGLEYNKVNILGHCQCYLVLTFPRC